MDFRPAFLDGAAQASCQVIELEYVDVDYYRFLYGAVGGPWNWTDRLRESCTEELRQGLASPEMSVDVFYVSGALVGFMESIREGRETEIIYFGLREAFLGRGLGKHFLSVGVQRIWDSGAQRVWLHTCNMDGPNAMSNYLKRGFQVFQVDKTPFRLGCCRTASRPRQTVRTTRMCRKAGATCVSKSAVRGRSRAPRR